MWAGAEQGEVSIDGQQGVGIDVDQGIVAAEGQVPTDGGGAVDRDRVPDWMTTSSVAGGRDSPTQVAPSVQPPLAAELICAVDDHRE